MCAPRSSLLSGEDSACVTLPAGHDHQLLGVAGTELVALRLPDHAAGRGRSRPAARAPGPRRLGRDAAVEPPARFRAPPGRAARRRAPRSPRGSGASPDPRRRRARVGPRRVPQPPAPRRGSSAERSTLDVGDRRPDPRPSAPSRRRLSACVAADGRLRTSAPPAAEAQGPAVVPGAEEDDLVDAPTDGQRDLGVDHPDPRRGGRRAGRPARRRGLRRRRGRAGARPRRRRSGVEGRVRSWRARWAASQRARDRGPCRHASPRPGQGVIALAAAVLGCPRRSDR